MTQISRRQIVAVGPMLSIPFCVCILLFAFVFTIIISLIPIYLPYRTDDKSESIQSSFQQVIYPIPSGNIFLIGPLTQTQLDYLVGQLQTRLDDNSTTAGSRIQSANGFISFSTTQKRTRQAIQQQQFLTFIYRILYRLGVGTRRRNLIFKNANKFIREYFINFNNLVDLMTNLSSQTSTSTSILTNSIGTNATLTTTASSMTNVTNILGYTPIDVSCPNGPFLFSGNALYPDEAAWLQERIPIAENSLRIWLQGIGLNVNDYNATTLLPRIGLATSGGGYRSLLTGAGVIQAFDGREEIIRTGFSGLLQGITYQTGTSGGAWFLISFAINNYPTISSIRDSLWIQRLQYFVMGPNPVQLDYNLIVIKEIAKKKAAGFTVTAADVWSRHLAFQLIAAPNGGANVTFDQIILTDAFRSHSLPFPIITTLQLNAGECIPLVNTSVFEFTPYAFGSWDIGINSFTPIKYLGTIYNNGQPSSNGQCTLGFDNAGFILGTSSFLFNVIGCRVLTDGTILLDPISSTSDLAMTAVAILEETLTVVGAITAENALSAVYPNPFKGSEQSPKIISLSQLNFVDGGEASHNIPVWPLIQPARKVDLIIVNDNSGDTSTNFPDGSSLVTNYMEAKRVGLPFPFIPDINIFISQKLNVRPTFFGCNETDVPLIIYIPNTNISYPSGVSTFKPTYSPDETRGLIQNGLNVATQNNSIQWTRCVACAIARCIQGLYRSTTSVECRNCFDQYCYRNS